MSPNDVTEPFEAGVGGLQATGKTRTIRGFPRPPSAPPDPDSRDRIIKFPFSIAYGKFRTRKRSGLSCQQHSVRRQSITARAHRTANSG